MALVAGAGLNLTAKQKTVSGTEVIGWTDQVTGTRELSVPVGEVGPQTGTLLNGVDILTFSNNVLQLNDGLNQREPDSGKRLISYAVFKPNFPSSITRSLIDSGGLASGNSVIVYPSTDQKVGGDAAGRTSFVTPAVSEWQVLTVVHSRVTGERKIYINGELVYEGTGTDAGTRSATGITIGQRADLVSEFTGEVAQIVEYYNVDDHSPEQVRQNVAHFETEWGLDLLAAQWNPYKVQGMTLPGQKVIYITADDRNFTNSAFEIVTTDAQGLAPPTNIPAGKHVFVNSTYEVPNPDPATLNAGDENPNNGLIIGQTYSGISRWIDGYPA